MSTNKQKGDHGEAVAKADLIRKGYRILETNYRCSQGEADIIARDQDGETVVFVEVKYRAGHRGGYPREAVDERKQKRIHRIALHYIAAKNMTDTPCRFDVMEVTGVYEFSVEHIENAFW